MEYVQTEVANLAKYLSDTDFADKVVAADMRYMEEYSD
jgi:hypothetical protein